MSDEIRVAVREPGVVMLPVPVAEAVRQWEEYQELTKKLLEESDYQEAGGGKRFKKKSAWRKYAKAFNLSDEVTFEHIQRDASCRPVYARVRVRVTAANGRVSEADHECHVTEKCCPAAFGEACEKAEWESHTCCPADCTGWRHWSHPGDIPATATTRAKNRAISDMIGAGEVSAEEMDGASPAATAQKLCPACGKPAIIKGKAEYGGGWLCFKKRGGCGWKAPDHYDWTKPKIEPDLAEKTAPAQAAGGGPTGRPEQPANPAAPPSADPGVDRARQPLGASPPDRSGFPGQVIPPSANAQPPSDLEQLHIRIREALEAQGKPRTWLQVHAKKTWGLLDPNQMTHDQAMSVLLALSVMAAER